MTHSQPTIVVGLDGSDAARRAATAAAALGERAGARLVLVGVHVPPPFVGAPVLPQMEAPTRASVIAEDHERVVAELEQERDRVGLTAADIRAEVGMPAERLLAVVEDEGARLLVVGTREQGALRAAVLGSTVTELIMGASVPILAVPADVDAGPLSSVVCGVVDSAESTLAATAAERLATLFGATLVLVHVAERDADPEAAQAMLRDVSAALGSPGEVELVVRTGEPAEELSAVADERGAAVVAVGSRGLGPARSVLLSSTSRAVLAIGRHAVLATPPGSVDRLLAAG